VHSTDLNLSLEISFLRAEVKAFWILATIVVAVVLWATSAALGARMPWMWAGAALFLPLPRVVYAEWFELGVRAWNKCTRLVVIALQAFVLKVCYYLLFAAVGSVGSSLDRAQAGGDVSGWIARRNLAAGENRRTRSTLRQSAHGLFAAVQRPGSVWMIFLVPVVLLLRMLAHGQQDTAPSSSTYTLY
jgi:hypothetical protein